MLAGPPPAPATSSPQALEAWRARDAAAQKLNLLDPRIEALRQLANAAPDSESRFRELDLIVTALGGAGQFARQLSERDAIIEDRRIGPGRRAVVAASQSRLLAIGGEFARSLRTVSRGKSLASEASADEMELLPSDPSIAVLGAEVVVYQRRGELPRAVQLSQQMMDAALAIDGDVTASPKRRQAARATYYGQMWNHTHYLDMVGRRDEAMALIRHAQRQAAERRNPAVSPSTLGSLDYALARSLATAGDYESALVSIDASLAQFTEARLHEHDNNKALARRLRAIILLGLNRVPDMTGDIEAVVAAQGGNPTLAGNTNRFEIDALRALAAGRIDEATARSNERVQDALRWFGRHTSTYKTARAQQLIVRLADAAKPIGTAEMESYLDTIAAGGTRWSDASQRGIEVEAAALERIIARLGDDTVSHALALRAAEHLRMDASQGALLLGAAKMAAGSPELRVLIEREQVILSEGLDKRRLAASAQSGTDRLAKAQGTDEFVLKRQRAEADEKAKALASADNRLDEVRREISQKFPRYQELVSPRIPTAAEIGKALRPDEVYVNFFPGREHGYAVLVRPGGELSAWRVPLTRQATKDLVQRFRQSFDSGAVPTKANDWAGLDAAAGAQLHQVWLTPLFARIGAGKTIYISASGPLAALPWAALPSCDVASPRDTRWAIEQAAFATMPSASSLVLVRSLESTAGDVAMRAYADPSFDGAAPVASTVVRRDVRPAAYAPVNRGATAFDYRRVARLPETLDEVRAIGSLLGADSGSVVSGEAATRTRVLKDDLSRARVLAFATHGIVPGELPGFHKAGLAMAYEGSGLADSILSVDDVTGLRLNADIVLLSACNTGLTSGGAGDTVSALARGFFVAGAHSLLVTAWAVESQSAMELTVKTFAALKADPKASRAQSLAQAQRAMLGGSAGELYRHPYFWAPYFVVGDAAR